MNVIAAALEQHDRQCKGRDIEQLFTELAAVRDDLRRMREQLEILRTIVDH
jgi:hypothetical protein